MLDLSELQRTQPILPYIRECDYAIRLPYYFPYRKLLDYLIIYVQEGTLIVHADNQEHRFTSGDFCLLQPGTIHDLHGLTNTITPYAHLDFFYQSDRELSFPTRAGQTDVTAYQQYMQPKLNDLSGVRIPIALKPKEPVLFRDRLLEMMKNWRDPSPLRKLESQCLAMELVCSIIRDHSKDDNLSSSSVQSFNWITSYFSFRLSEPLSIQDMAGRANLSPSRFRELFKQEFGIPPHQYLLNLRIQHAQELLATTELSQDKIAVYCGFADVHHFSKMFRKRVGRSPGSYRSEVRP
ncbi:helix-turn-helix domain-containing protein [Cohnella yongneupensis]|uniref:Helix-turn-helix domain-containing protein n=1 Tax=Cohnella yongneupensis TaxID=425006 RepID=A0ABW0QYR7_9BACL